MTTTQRTVDAKNRALRTFAQGLAADVLAAVILLVLPVFSNAQGWQDIDWKVLGFLLAKTVVVTGLSFVMRQYLDKSTDAFLPPADPGEPDDPTKNVANEGGYSTLGLVLLGAVGALVVLIFLDLVGVIVLGGGALT